LSQQLKKIATDEYERKIMNEQIKIQPKSSIAYINIMKELKTKDMKFTYINESKRGVLVLKHIHATTNLDDIKK